MLQPSHVHSRFRGSAHPDGAAGLLLSTIAALRPLTPARCGGSASVPAYPVASRRPAGEVHANAGSWVKIFAHRVVIEPLGRLPPAARRFHRVDFTVAGARVGGYSAFVTVEFTRHPGNLGRVRLPGRTKRLSVQFGRTIRPPIWGMSDWDIPRARG